VNNLPDLKDLTTKRRKKKRETGEVRLIKRDSKVCHQNLYRKRNPRVGVRKKLADPLKGGENMVSG